MNLNLEIVVVVVVVLVDQFGILIKYMVDLMRMLLVVKEFWVI
jgi:hypothetical protein